MCIRDSFYSSEVAYGYLIVAAVLYFFLYYMGKFGMTQKIFFLLIGVITVSYTHLDVYKRQELRGELPVAG